MAPDRERRIDAVIFDLDGVLVATDELHYRAWKRLAEEEGIEFDRAVGPRLRGVGRMESLEIVLEGTAKSYSAEQKHRLAERKNALYRELAQGLGPGDVLAGVVRLLGELGARGVKVAVASSSKNARLILERTGLAGRFDAIVDGNDTDRSKPDPALFLLAAGRLGVPPSRCLAVEDGLSGLESARRAGMAVVGIGVAGQLPGVDRVLAGLADVTVEMLLGG
jgi:beta-phosphoglucomutase